MLLSATAWRQCSTHCATADQACEVCDLAQHRARPVVTQMVRGRCAFKERLPWSCVSPIAIPTPHADARAHPTRRRRPLHACSGRPVGNGTAKTGKVAYAAAPEWRSSPRGPLDLTRGKAGQGFRIQIQRPKNPMNPNPKIPESVMKSVQNEPVKKKGFLCSY